MRETEKKDAKLAGKRGASDRLNVNTYANYLPDSESDARWPVAEDVAAFHWQVFSQFGLTPSTFGGTPLGAWGGVIAPGLWCPNCTVKAEAQPW